MNVNFFDLLRKFCALNEKKNGDRNNNNKKYILYYIFNVIHTILFSSTIIFMTEPSALFLT